MIGRPRRADLVGQPIVRQWVRLSEQTARSIAAHAAAEGISAAEWIARAARREVAEIDARRMCAGVCACCLGVGCHQCDPAIVKP